MKPAKTEKKENQVSKSINENFHDFNGRLDLILKLIRIMINLSISEGKILDLNKKKELIKKYNDMFKAAKNEFNLNLQEILSNDFLNDIMKNLSLFNNKLIQLLKAALSYYNKFLLNKISVDILVDNLIDLFGKSIAYVKNNKGKNLSFDLIKEFYSYLDDISKRAEDLKQLSSKKKSKEEELKIKEKEESVSKYYLKIETLKKTLEEKENELNSTNEQLMTISLDLGAYKEMNEDLTKRVREINDNPNGIIVEKNKSIDDYKDIINRIEQKFSKFEKSNSALSKKVSQNERKIIELEKSNSFLKKINRDQNMKIQQLENEMQNLMAMMELNKKENKEINKAFTDKWRELKTYIIQLEDGNQFLFDNLNDLENSVTQFMMDYEINNPNIFDNVDTDFYNYNFFNKN